MLFDYQRSLAHLFGYTDDADNAAVEAFMQLLALVAQETDLAKRDQG